MLFCSWRDILSKRGFSKWELLLVWNLMKAKAWDWLFIILAFIGGAVVPSIYSGINIEELIDILSLALIMTLGYFGLVLILEVVLPAVVKALCKHEALRKLLNSYGIGRTDLNRGGREQNGPNGTW